MYYSLHFLYMKTYSIYSSRNVFVLDALPVLPERIDKEVWPDVSWICIWLMSGMFPWLEHISSAVWEMTILRGWGKGVVKETDPSSISDETGCNSPSAPFVVHYTRYSTAGWRFKETRMNQHKLLTMQSFRFKYVHKGKSKMLTTYQSF